MGEFEVKSVVKKIAGLGIVAGLLVPAASMAAATDGVAGAAAQTQSVYNQFSVPPIWYRGNVESPAVGELVRILQRAAFDGFASGPALAAQVQAAAQAARSGQASDIAAAERVLSSAWVAYVQSIKRPTQGMIYAYPSLQPQGSRTEQVLLTTAAQASVQSYIASVADVNPIYKSLRDAAWAEAQATGNMTPDARLLANLDRVRSLPAKGRFLLVDSGSSMLTLYQDGQALDSMKVITGTEQLPTPLIASTMYYITYNPYWHAPDHLVRKTIAPNYLKLGASYLKSHGYRVIEDWSENFKELDPKAVDWKAAAAGKAHLKIQQDPGPLNSMGILKFPFPNPEDIYLHDTPDHSKFALAKRNLSNGCVRVEDAKRLGRWLIGSEPVAPGKDAETHVQLPTGTPIYLTYITAQVKDGKVTYLPDVYGWDKAPPRFASASN